MRPFFGLLFRVEALPILREVWTNFSIFSVAVNSNLEAFAQPTLLVAGSLSAARTLGSGHYSSGVHVLAVCGCFLLLSAAAALDDEEFFVIEGSM